MYLYFLGESGFKIKTERATIVIDPPHKNTGLSQSALSADIIVVSHASQTDVGRVTESEKDARPFIINAPGEYETRGVFLYAFQGKNDTVLSLIKADNLSIAHLAGISEILDDKTLELFEGAEIALVPVGGNGVLSPKLADQVISQIEPHIVIPMNFAIPKLTIARESVDTFLSEMGAKGLQAESSLYITKEKLPHEETKVVLLQVKIL